MIKPAVATLELFRRVGREPGRTAGPARLRAVALFGRDEVVARDLGPHLKLTATEIDDVGIRIVGQLRFHLCLFLRAELRRERSGDFRGQLALQSDRILEGYDRNGPTKVAVRSLRQVGCTLTNTRVAVRRTACADTAASANRCAVFQRSRI